MTKEIDDLNKACDMAEKSGMELLKKSERPNHVAYTRHTASGATVNVKQKGSYVLHDKGANIYAGLRGSKVVAVETEGEATKFDYETDNPDVKEKFHNGITGANFQHKPVPDQASRPFKRGDIVTFHTPNPEEIHPDGSTVKYTLLDDPEKGRVRGVAHVDMHMKPQDILRLDDIKHVDQDHPEMVKELHDAFEKHDKKGRGGMGINTDHPDYSTPEKYLKSAKNILKFKGHDRLGKQGSAEVEEMLNRHIRQLES